MKESSTSVEIKKLHKLLKSDPKKYVDITSHLVSENRNSSDAYFSRHFGWMAIGQPGRAMEDLNKAIELEPDSISYMSRGNVHRHLGQYEEALRDYSLAEACDPQQWQDDTFGLLYQADTHARLGDEAAAMECCSRLPDDFWTPGLQGAPAGDKSEVAASLKTIAAKARKRNL